MWIRDRGYETALIVSVLITYIISSVLCFIGHPLAPRSKDIFPNQQVQWQQKTFFTQVEPPAWVHVTLWLVVFIWQLVWLLYGILTIFRKGLKENIFCSPGVVPFRTYVLFLFAQIMQLAWILFLDVEILTMSLLSLSLLALTLWFCLGLACIRIANVGTLFNTPERNISMDLWLTLIIVHNGLGIFAAWSSVATLFCFGDTLHLAWGVAEDTSGTVALVLLIIECTSWVIVDLVFLDRYTRYLLTPYIVIPFALIGSLISNVSSIANLVEANSILTMVLLCFSGIFLLVKILVLCVRHLINYKNIYGVHSSKLAYVANSELTAGTINPKTHSFEDLTSGKNVEYVTSYADVEDDNNAEPSALSSIMKTRESLDNASSNTPLGSMREGVIMNTSTGEVEANDMEYIYVPNIVATDVSSETKVQDNSLQRPLDMQQEMGRLTASFDDPMLDISGKNNEGFEDIAETISNVETLSYHTADEGAPNDGYDTVSNQTEFEESFEYIPVDVSLTEEEIKSELETEIDSKIKDADSISLHSQDSTLTLTNVANDETGYDDHRDTVTRQNTLADNVNEEGAKYENMDETIQRRNTEDNKTVSDDEINV